MKKVFLSLLIIASLTACSSAPATTPNKEGETTTVSTTMATPKEKADMKSEEVLKAMKSKGVKIGEVVTYTESTDPNNLLGRPGGYVSKSNFELEGDEKISGEDPSNTLEVYPKEEEAISRKKYIEEIGKASPMFLQYIYQSGKYVLRLEKKNTPTVAKEIENIFLEIVK